MRFSLRPPDDASLARVLEVDATADLTYAAVGATAADDHPVGYRLDAWEVDVGEDDGGRFHRCGEALLAWGAQRGAGIRVYPDRRVRLNDSFVLALPLPIGHAIATARVVYVVETADRMGFAYGTLPSHPEEGEEMFMMRRGAGRVTFEVRAFSRPRDPLARLGFPVTRWLQVRTNRAYLSALRRIADRP